MNIKLFHSLSPSRNKIIRKINSPKTGQIPSKPNSININLLSSPTKQKKKKLNIKEISNIFSYDEEYVSKLKYFSPELNLKGNKKETLYNINISSYLPTLFKKFPIPLSDMNNFDMKKKFISQINLKNLIFEKNTNEDMEHSRYIGRLENMYKESTLEKKRHEIETKIEKIKSLIDPLSKELSDILNQIESSKIDLEIFKNYKNYSLLNNAYHKKKYLRKDSRSNLSFYSNFQNSKSSDDSFVRKGNSEKMKSDKLTKKKKLIIENYKLNTMEKLAMLNNKKNNILVKLDACERDLKEFKEKHSIVKNELLVHYHKLLLEGKDTRKDGLSWIIQAIWNLKSNIIMSFMPKFLDKDSISFLFLYSDKLIEISKIQKKIEIINGKIKNREKKTRNLAILSSKIFNNTNEEKQIENINIYSLKSMHKKKKNSEINTNTNNNNSKEFEKIIDDIDNDYNGSNNLPKFESEDINQLKSINVEFKRNNISIGKHHDNTTRNMIKIKRLFSQPDLFSSEIITEKEEKEKTINSNFSEILEETFKTSLYKTNSICKNETKNIKNPTSTKNIRDLNKRLTENLKNAKKVINQEYFEQIIFPITTQKKIKVKDYENFKNFKIEDSLDSELLLLFKSHKEMQKQLQKLKNEADQLVRDELDRIGKSFYLEDYAGKYNTNFKTVIGALIGEDNIRNEIFRQEKEQKDYFKTIKSIRNFNGICNQKYKYSK